MATNQTTRRRFARARRAFTLTELLIAIGIMGVGLTMVSALFPAAAKETANSTYDIIGSIVCHNAVGTIKARLTYPLKTSGGATIAPPTLVLITPDSTPTPADVQVAAGDMMYPMLRTGEPATTRGWMGFVRQIGGNDYQFVVVSYQKEAAADTVEAHLLAGLGNTCAVDLDGRAYITAPGGNSYLLPGSPVILADGTFATITARKANDQAYLDHSLPTSPGSVYVIAEKDSGGVYVGVRSPAMAVLVNRTALRQ